MACGREAMEFCPAQECTALKMAYDATAFFARNAPMIGTIGTAAKRRTAVARSIADHRSERFQHAARHSVRRVSQSPESTSQSSLADAFGWGQESRIQASTLKEIRNLCEPRIDSLGAV